MLNTPLALNDLVRLDRQIHRDQNLPLRQLQERDRALGAELKDRADRRRLQAWLEHTAEPDSKLQHLRGVESSVGFWLALLGLVLGAMAMSGVLLVEHNQPVNVLLFLTIFVAAQWLLLLLTLIVAFASAIQPHLHLPLEGLNPARWLFQRQMRKAAGQLRLEQINPVVRLLLLTGGQLFGVFFNSGAMLALLMILLVVDRSFGWSSTLDISAEGLHTWLHWLSRPWASWLPEATVSEELILQTRYQSLQTDFAASQVVAMRGWWPFLFACIGFYGLLPRVVLWIGFYLRYRQQLTRTFLNYPGARLVLDRMSSPLVHTQGQAHERALDTSGEALYRPRLPVNRPRIIINWSGAVEDNSARLAELGLDPQELESAGISLAQDRDLLQKINELRRDVVVLVKSWEPPLSELGDFLRGVSPKLDCYLLLIPLPGRPVKAEALTDWQQFARQRHHPRLLVVSGGTSSISTGSIDRGSADTGARES